SVHHIWCPLFSQEFQDLPDGAETTLTAFIPAISNVFIPFCMTGAPISLLPHLCLMTVCTAMHIY
ncbi:hypothetical protein QU847_08465, partial [Escherichia coli]|nr:hypothetical protein [Escherichia coli]MDM8938613.1 hypothetical protein [Escherichia coli]MDM8945117.1 hypothetical protein [Escherichia coli]MDM8949441.1 hypothetical protein [Escherichia coli]MDM8953198.1 hypothetical protein [Escherichia coli]